MEKAAYKTASILAEKAGLTADEEKASFITHMSITLYYALKDYRSWLAENTSSKQPPQQTSEPEQAKEQSLETEETVETERLETAAEQQDVAETLYAEGVQAAETPEPVVARQDTVLLDELVENGPKSGTAYLLDEEAVKAPGLPSAVLASHPWRNCKAYDMDSSSYAVIKAETAFSNEPVLLILTRAIYPSTLRRVSVDRSYKGFVVLLKTLELPRPMAVLTHKTVYEAFPENLRQKLKPVKVVLRLRQAVERCSRTFSAETAAKLAVAEALLPGICQTLAGGGVEDLQKLLKQRLADDQDAEMIASALAAVVSGDENALKNLPRALLEALGLPA